MHTRRNSFQLESLASLFVDGADQQQLQPRAALRRDCRRCPPSPQDLPGALSEAQVAEALGLHDIKTRDWAIYKTSAIKGEGLFEGLDWLSNALKSRPRR